MKTHFHIIIALLFSASTFAIQNKVDLIPADNFKTTVNNQQTA